MEKQGVEKIEHLIVDHIYFTGAKEELRRCLESCGKTHDPRCIAILGPSGSGKSTVIDEFIKNYQPTETDDGWRKPIIVVETPSNPTVKTMASELLQALGDPLYSRGTEVQMTDRITKYLIQQGTHLLIFDEMQSLVDRDSAKLNHKVADWLKRLINKTRIPTVISGLEQAEKLFLANEQLRRRFRQPYIMSSFEWSEPEKRRVLRGFLNALQGKLQLEEGLVLASNPIAFRFYCATGGLVGYIMAIIREAQELAAQNHGSIIGMAQLAEAYSNVACGNHLIGVNPFLSDSKDDIEAALRVVEPSLVTKGEQTKQNGRRKGIR